MPVGFYFALIFIFLILAIKSYVKAIFAYLRAKMGKKISHIMTYILNSALITFLITFAFWEEKRHYPDFPPFPVFSRISRQCLLSNSNSL